MRKRIKTVPIKRKGWIIRAIIPIATVCVEKVNTLDLLKVLE